MLRGKEQLPSYIQVAVILFVSNDGSKHGAAEFFDRMCGVKSSLIENMVIASNA
jgi:hypothetical protein